jgi:polyisoprenoid-binding protein YceI
MNKALLSISFLLLSISTWAQTINQANSVIKFDVRNMKMRTVEGTIKGLNGTVKFDPSNAQSGSFNVCADLSTINTENEKRDKHLRTEDFFEVEKYPKMCFVSSSVSKTGSGFLTKGKLTIKDVTKEVEIPFTYTNGTLEGKITVLRYDYNVGTDTGEFMVANEINVTIIAVLN